MLKPGTLIVIFRLGWGPLFDNKGGQMGRCAALEQNLGKSSRRGKMYGGDESMHLHFFTKRYLATPSSIQLSSCFINNFVVQVLYYLASITLSLLRFVSISEGHEGGDFTHGFIRDGKKPPEMLAYHKLSTLSHGRLCSHATSFACRR